MCTRNHARAPSPARRHWAKIDDHVQAPMARVVGARDSEVCAWPACRVVAALPRAAAGAYGDRVQPHVARPDCVRVCCHARGGPENGDWLCVCVRARARACACACVCEWNIGPVSAWTDIAFITVGQTAVMNGI